MACHAVNPEPAMAKARMMKRKLPGMSTTTKAVIRLREATAVATSRPLLKASRAATWLAPMRQAMRTRVRNAWGVSARAVMGGPYRIGVRLEYPSSEQRA